ncbi:substrate-binding domain-containing protein [Salegentibacter salegens]|uniref:histidine kinase n=1 Tax=Salegentibacter salegens TaxID=143223 RepID=A0A1M7MNG3_9FLAO|nr:substrate-binding domain-containing protein [Salegentibacter salegens]PRX52600.1 ABC-type sugar transport system substrate-binding protein [Salegentibacter salegens]SHM92594.1 monosaccharide ABC transporter substrate-binding protein, CUT2 family [Salegentibacter salegens]
MLDLNQLRKIFIAVLLILSSCDTSEKQEQTYKIGFAQAMTTDNWREEMNRAMKVEASMHPDFNLQIKDAQNDVAKQIKQIEDFISKEVDVLIVSPIQSVPITPVIEKAMKAGIPTIVIDRKIEGSNYTAYVGANNIEIGKNAANYIVSNSKPNQEVELIEITGLQTSSPAFERSQGFHEVLAYHENTKIVATIAGDWEKTSVGDNLKSILDSVGSTDYIFAHNDRMAMGAWEIARSKNLEDSIQIIGVDGLFGPNGGIQLVKEDILTATVLYPTGGAEAIKLAVQLLEGDQIDKNNILNTVVIDEMNVDIMQNQFNKMNQQQNDIEQQQSVIREQITTYNSQTNLLKIMVGLILLLLLLGFWAVYLVFKLKKRKRILELNNEKIITQRNQIEKFAEQLKISNEVKINFFTALSHEFKTPLTLITSAIESIAQNHHKQLKDFSYETNLISKNSGRLLRLINELLDFRKLESGSFRLKPLKTNLYEFIKNIYQDFETEAIRKSIDLDLAANNKEIIVYIDRDMMDKVFFNMLSNAFKFTPKNGQISIKIEKTGNNKVEVRFKDSGIGIPKEDFQKIFDPFRQAGNNTKPSSGLGLYITRQFIELHKGSISVSSHQGAEFRIELLQGKNHLSEYLFSEDTSEIENEKSEMALQPKFIPEELPQSLIENAETILIIEDNEDLSYLLKKRLLGDYQVKLSDGTDAISKALEIIPDIIICDINLPEKSGFEICKELKSDLRTSHIPTLILTALSDEESRIKALKAGADSYISKPFRGVLAQLCLLLLPGVPPGEENFSFSFHWWLSPTLADLQI